jgi:hypothetical protein
VLALFLVGAVVLGTVGSVAALSPDVAGAQVQEQSPAESAEAGPVPVDESDYEFDVSLDRLARECADGNLVSCDALYEESDQYSAYEEYGSTCGARTTAGYHGECSTRFD